MMIQGKDWDQKLNSDFLEEISGKTLPVGSRTAVLRISRAAGFRPSKLAFILFCNIASIKEFVAIYTKTGAEPLN